MVLEEHCKYFERVQMWKKIMDSTELENSLMLVSGHDVNGEGDLPLRSCRRPIYVSLSGSR